MNPEGSESVAPVYFAGELFSAKHLCGNALLAAAVWRAGAGRYRIVLPQNIEVREGAGPRHIRDADLRALTSCAAAIFNLDGPEPDAGTVAEFLFAKFADLPAVLLRTDSRSGGDQPGGEPWNLMLSGYPRTCTVLVPALELYHGGGKLPDSIADETAASATMERVRQVINLAAQQIVAALDKAMASPSWLRGEQERTVKSWIEQLIEA